MIKQVLSTVLLAATALVSIPGMSCEEEPGLAAEGQWIREAPPGMQMMAGYTTLKNNTDKDIEVLGVESPAFNAIEMHTTKIIDGTARMIEQEKLLVPAHGSLTLAPGGYHLMLMMPAKLLKAGDHVNMVLFLNDKKQKTVDFEVKKASSMPMHH